MSPAHGAKFRLNVGWNRRRSDGVIAVVAVAAILWPLGAAFGEYGTEGSYTATVPEAVELSGLVASPRYPNWYWTHSDVWKSDDDFSACSGMSGAALAKCRQIQRTRLWALKIDPATHKVLKSRSFRLSKPAWALDPVIAQNNDWEDIAVGPPRDGRANLIIGALGDAAQNRVYDDGRDITCHTRRLIELREPNLRDPEVRTWRPWRIFDIKNYVGLGGIKTCNVESLLVSKNGAGKPTAYLVTKTLGRVLARSLVADTGRKPGARPATPSSDLPYAPAVDYVGVVRDAKELWLTAGDTSGAYASLLARKTSRNPCKILTWPTRSTGLGATLTGTNPARSTVSCNSLAEGLAYVRNPRNPAVITNDLMAISDTNGPSKFHYWYYPSS